MRDWCCFARNGHTAAGPQAAGRPPPFNSYWASHMIMGMPRSMLFFRSISDGDLL